MQVRVRKIGTSYGVIIPKEVLDRMKAGEDDTLIIRDMEKKEEEEVQDIKGTSPGLTFEREHGTDRF